MYAQYTYAPRHTSEIVRFDGVCELPFRTHVDPSAQRLHFVSEIILKPAKWNLQAFAYMIQPLPGKDKDFPLRGVVIRIVAFIVWVITLLPAIASTLVGISLRMQEHRNRPFMSKMQQHVHYYPQLNESMVTSENPLHVRVHNVGMVTEAMSIMNDLRPPVDRAHEIVWDLKQNLHQPDVVLFLEAFHEDATRVLCEGLKDSYPYIVHSVAPQISGFNSGAMVASKYPFSAKFIRLDHNLSPETMAPKGTLRIQINHALGPLFLYSVHLQALLGEDRAKARELQLRQIYALMQNDNVEFPDNIGQMVMGDLNTSEVTAWGESNVLPAGQSEERVLTYLNANFHDLHNNLHDQEGRRLENGPIPRKLPPHNAKDTGTWDHGPYADPGFFLSFKMKFDRWWHNKLPPHPWHSLYGQPSHWGRTTYEANRVANTARFDRALFMKGQNKLDGVSVIRRPEHDRGTHPQSGPSDHLPVDAFIWRQNTPASAPTLDHKRNA